MVINISASAPEKRSISLDVTIYYYIFKNVGQIWESCGDQEQWRGREWKQLEKVQNFPECKSSETIRKISVTAITFFFKLMSFHMFYVFLHNKYWLYNTVLYCIQSNLSTAATLETGEKWPLQGGGRYGEIGV